MNKWIRGYTATYRAIVQHQQMMYSRYPQCKQEDGHAGDTIIHKVDDMVLLQKNHFYIVRNIAKFGPCEQAHEILLDWY